jgi:hypothetical protein
MGLAGFLFGAYGSLAYAAMAIVAAAGGGLAIVAHRLWRGDALAP